MSQSSSGLELGLYQERFIGFRSIIVFAKQNVVKFAVPSAWPQTCETLNTLCTARICQSCPKPQSDAEETSPIKIGLEVGGISEFLLILMSGWLPFRGGLKLTFSAASLARRSKAIDSSSAGGSFTKTSPFSSLTWNVERLRPGWETRNQSAGRRCFCKLGLRG